MINEVIVVDDGSTDKTKDILHSLTGITVYHIPHAGKAAALNYGITRALYDIVLVDADTIVKKDTIALLVRNLQMYDAVAGNVQVLNRKNFLERAQAVEHVRASMFKRVAQYFDDVDIIPGPIGAFKRDIFTQIRYGISMVEDMELTQKIREKGFSIGYEQMAKVYTRMPGRWVPFLKQRFRWAKGNVQLMVNKDLSLKKVLTGYVLAFLDLFFVAICFVNQYYGVLSLFFLIESLTMVIGNFREKGGCFLESVLFPVFMLFFDGVFLLSHIAGAVSLFRESLNTPSRGSKPRT
jgi:cellulose synthase/poly-beta-1,6-N-acetylglucosamine synthase-like glycosyltransferase